MSLTLLTGLSDVCAFADPEPPLISLKQFCEMGRLEVAKRSPIRLRGTVTYVEREWQTLCIQTGEHAVSVYMNVDAAVETGQLIEVTGNAEFGQLVPFLMLTSARVIGEAKLPTPIKFSASDRVSPDLLYRWSEFEGDIYSAVEDDHRVYLSVCGPSFGMYMIMYKSPDLPPLSELRTSRIRARGTPVFSSEKSAPWRFDLLVPVQGIIEVTPNPTATDQLKFRKTSEIWQKEMRGAVEAPVRIRAVVRAVSDENLIFISDESGALAVEVSDRASIASLHPGDVVEVQGQADRNSTRMMIQSAMVRYIGKGYSHPAVRIEPSVAKKHLAQLIEIDGTVVAESLDRKWLMLQKNGTFFRIRYPVSLEKLAAGLATGSSLTVTGACWVSSLDDAEFEVIAQSMTPGFTVPSGIVVEAEAGQAASGSSTSLPDRTSTEIDWLRPTLMTLFVILLSTLILLMRRRMIEQKKFYDSIHEQLSNLSHIARLNTLAEMVGALAHELNQPLASVSNYAATAELISKKEPADPAKLESLLNHIRQDAFRAGEIIRKLRHLVRKKTPGSLPVSIAEIVQESLELFKTQHVTASGLVELNLPENIPNVQADSIQIQQVVLNLLLNARDATEAETERISAIVVSVASDNGTVSVTVSDNGIGIANSTPDTIFEPYFTTRDTGTGLGLAISRTIIETHGGKISARNGSPHGTEITFTLPTSAAQKTSRLGADKKVTVQ